MRREAAAEWVRFVGAAARVLYGAWRSGAGRGSTAISQSGRELISPPPCPPASSLVFDDFISAVRPGEGEGDE